MLGLLSLLGCDAERPDELLVFARGDDGYAILPAGVPALEDPRRMSGELGSVAHGGRLVGADPVRWTGGIALDVRYVVDDGIGVPVDEDGLLLWSFYAHLAAARDRLSALGVDTSSVFPVDIAWNPAVSPLFELQPADNAAYAIGSNLFLLLPDGGDRDVPLLANEGVVIHEMGHAVFHLLTAGDPLVQPLVSDRTTSAGGWQASLHEGFADTLATLLLDDPAFLAPSIDLPARRVDGGAVLTAALLPEDTAADPAAALFADPYPLGTVFASTFWDVRVRLDDPERTLQLVLRGLEAWQPEHAADVEGASFLAAVFAEADADEAAALCAAIDAHMAGLVVVDGCGG